MHPWKRAGLAILLFLALCLLAGCAIVGLDGETVASAPNLAQLQMPPYNDAASPEENGTDSGSAYLRVDLWMDASQVMGGINPNEQSLFPHSSKRYREGGFHYRYKLNSGWYENVLRDMLEATDGANVRILRVGNERLSDEFLVSQGLVDGDANAPALASMRRDLLTYAINPLPSLFSEMSMEDMAGSFYSLGSPKLNQMSRFATDNGAQLENPGKVQEMSDSLDVQIADINSEFPTHPDFLRSNTREDNDCSLYYALQNIDLSRMSIITFDPAGLRRLSGTDTAGKPVAYYEQLLRERGVYDKGLCVGMYAFTLDYMGQIASIGPADLAEPLIWGKPIYSADKRDIDYLGVMPRTLMAFVIGREEQVESYMAKLSQTLDGDSALGGLRGPQKGELTYTRNQETVAQQPFTFEYKQTIISRPNAGLYTQHTAGTGVSVEAGEGSVARKQGLETVTLQPDAKGKQENRTLLIRFPLEKEQEDAKMDLSKLSGMGVEVLDSLLLTDVLPNTADAQPTPRPGEQILALRNSLYLYTRREEPFAENESASPFQLQSIGQSEDGTSLLCHLQVTGNALVEGYYRLQLHVDLTSAEVTWMPVDWIDGADSLSASISNEDIVRWEAFADAVATKEKGNTNIPRQFQHAWGSYTNKPYSGLTIPDCPPVEKALGLSELTSQLQDVATADKVAFVRFVFDVFVDNGAGGGAAQPVE